MRSKITIDLDWDNQPIIKIDYYASEDVRDKMVKKFLESFGGDSCHARFCYENPPSIEYNNTSAKIRPVKPEELDGEVEFMRGCCQNSTKKHED